MDGPNIFKLFTETDCLTATSNLSEICQWLRFFKDGDAEQIYLKKYLPKLAKPEFKDAFNEFVGRLDDKDLATELSKAVNVEPVKVEVLPEPQEKAEETEVKKEPKKKPGRKPKAI